MMAPTALKRISQRKDDHSLRLRFAAGVAAVLLGFPTLQAQDSSHLAFAGNGSSDRVSPSNAVAFRALQEGRMADAASLLHAEIAIHPEDAYARQILCRVAYAQDAADEAIHQCEAAVAADARSSDDQLWLGRAYGMKARRAGLLSGFALARKVHASFERAVELNPSNVAALNDLGEYYVDAPSIVGGGNDKAVALAARMMPQFPAAAHRLLALNAQDEKDLPTSEAEFKQVVAIQKASETHNSAEGWIDLAHFYQTHARPNDALAAIKSALAVDRIHGPVLVDAASILTAAHRAPDLAERCLRDYLAGRAQSDAAPVFKVHLQLARVLTARGDAAEAGKETQTAAALAPTFEPPTRSVQGS